jgi:dCTP deaminase
MLLTNTEIKELGIITPYVEKVQTKISYGADPAGYTLSLSDKFKFPVKNGFVVDPMDTRDFKYMFDDIVTDVYVLQPNSYVLGKAREYMKLPKDVTAIAFTKSTYARVGIFANITTIDAGWEGYLTIEIANLGSHPVKIYANHGIAQIHFFKHKPTEGYVGKYQGLKDIKV